MSKPNTEWNIWRSKSRRITATRVTTPDPAKEEPPYGYCDYSTRIEALNAKEACRKYKESVGRQESS